jgi:hypothetical protein
MACTGNPHTIDDRGYTPHHIHSNTALSVSQIFQHQIGDANITGWQCGQRVITFFVVSSVFITVIKYIADPSGRAV